MWQRLSICFRVLGGCEVPSSPLAVQKCEHMQALGTLKLKEDLGHPISSDVGRLQELATHSQCRGLASLHAFMYAELVVYAAGLK